MFSNNGVNADLGCIAVRTSLWLRVSSFLHRHFMRIYVIAKVKKVVGLHFLPAKFVDLSRGLLSHLYFFIGRNDMCFYLF